MLDNKIKTDLKAITDALFSTLDNLKTSEGNYICRRLLELANNMGNLIEVHDINNNYNEVNKYE